MTSSVTIKQQIDAELIQKLEEVMRKIKMGQVLSYVEKLDYEPVIGKNNEVERFNPTSYVVSFFFKDEVTGQDVKVSIDTKIGEKQ